MKMWYERIRELREDLPEKKSQSEIAAALKMTQRKLSYIETGKTEPSIQDMICICKYYRISADYILGLTDSKE
jgi:transcriptional regulator with XRE-family HTH domain